MCSPSPTWDPEASGETEKCLLEMNLLDSMFLFLE